MSKSIILSNGNLTTLGSTLVDDADYAYLSQFKWILKPNKHNSLKFHAVRNVEIGDKKVTIRMHRLITEARFDQCVFHINGDTLDNRRSNLQLRTMRPWTGRESGYRGVHQLKYSLWESYIDFNGTRYIIGTYNDPILAAKAYNRVANTLYGIQAHLNDIK